MSDRVSARAGTFTDNMRLPVHRWYRYSAGFSAEWVEAVLGTGPGRKESGPRRVLDPFSGSGTTVFTAARLGFEAVGCEAHPFVHRIAQAKAAALRCPPEVLQAGHTHLTEAAARRPRALLTEEPELTRRCFPEETLAALVALRDTFGEMQFESPDVREAFFLAITAVLRSCSSAGTAQWQYVLPRKSKSRQAAPATALAEKVRQLITDRAAFGHLETAPTLLHTDVRTGLPLGPFDVVTTSPPYANNYDYADATRLEMTFWREIGGWGDLAAVRPGLVRSCSQHAAAERAEIERRGADPALAPIADVLVATCAALSAERAHHGGHKRYDLMILAYFQDLAQILSHLRGVMAPGSTMHWVVGDSAPYGVHVPVDAWLGALATHHGFGPARFEKWRDRNLKWKNRKHRVPLQEGVLTLPG